VCAYTLLQNVKRKIEMWTKYILMAIAGILLAGCVVEPADPYYGRRHGYYNNGNGYYNGN
jgi:hypothetical protein